MSNLGINSPRLDIYRALCAAYNEKHRHYHNIDHLADCLSYLDQCKQLTKSSEVIELALWFHDAVYKTHHQDNERKSADWAVRFLESESVKVDLIECVDQLIMATLHNNDNTEPDAQLLVDIDLAILGQAAERYDEFEKQIRREYRWVPAPLFRRKRREILQAFLRRTNIYSTEYFQDLYEKPARHNLERTVAVLG